jgi:transposase
MECFAGLDISMEETHICVLDRDGAVIHEQKTISTSEAIAASLAKAPACRRIVFETGRMAPMLYHGLAALGLPIVCIESRQAYQALKTLATHKTDRNDARGLAHLARTGFFKPTHVKSLPAHAVRSLIIARKKLVGQRVMLENQIRGLAVVFGVRLPRALPRLYRSGIAGQRRDRWPVGCDARTGRGTDCGAFCRGSHRCRHEEDGQFLGCMPPADDHSRRRQTHRARLHRRR